MTVEIKEPQCQYRLGCHECHSTLLLIQASVRQCREALHHLEKTLSDFSKMVAEVMVADYVEEDKKQGGQV